MASKTILLLLCLTIIAVAYSAYVETEVAEDEDLSADDLLEYFQEQQMEKRGRKGRKAKVGSCTQPNGKPCAICNLKITNKMDRRRYIACNVNADRDIN